MGDLEVVELPYLYYLRSNLLNHGNTALLIILLSEEEEECCLFDHHHGSGGYIKTQYKSLTCRPPKYIYSSVMWRKK